jgi:general secretion pathway protein E
MLPALLERWQAQGIMTASPEGEERKLRELAEDAPVISYVNSLMAQAVEARASDVHVEPGEREFTVRMRIDGVLHLRQSQPMGRFAAVASRIKLISGLDIAERRLPQDGRTTMRVAGTEMDVRVSAIPSVHGESIVMRLLPKQRGDLSLELLGMEPDHLQMFERWLRWPNGMVLVTGPTGSGKSTTLYGALASVSDQQRKIVTVEDPVELRLPHIVQIQTQAEIGYTFARALRSILRHELSHGPFFTLPLFAAHVMRVWEQGFTQAERDAIRTFLGREGYDVKQDEVMANEAMAYLLFTPDRRFFDPARDLGWSDAQADRLRALLREGAPDAP